MENWHRNISPCYILKTNPRLFIYLFIFNTLIKCNFLSFLVGSFDPPQVLSSLKQDVKTSSYTENDYVQVNRAWPVCHMLLSADITYLLIYWYWHL